MVLFISNNCVDAFWRQVNDFFFLCVEKKATESDSVTFKPTTGPSSPIQVIDNTDQAEQTTHTPTQAQPTHATVSNEVPCQ